MKSTSLESRCRHLSQLHWKTFLSSICAAHFFAFVRQNLIDGFFTNFTFKMKRPLLLPQVLLKAGRIIFLKLPIVSKSWRKGNLIQKLALRTAETSMLRTCTSLITYLSKLKLHFYFLVGTLRGLDPSQKMHIESLYLETRDIGGLSLTWD